MASNEIIRLKNISINFNNNRILDDVSFSINKGEIVAFLGPSGAGKTTLLNILANFVKPDTGEMLIDGVPSISIKNRKEYAKKIGIIRQQFDLINQLPVIHNVLAGRLNQWGILKSIISLIKPQEKHLAENALNRVGILNKIFERTDNLSGGEQQRVALARLLVQNPEIVLADEPVSSLDPSRADNILSLLVDLAVEENQTLIVSLHSVEFLRKYFTRVIALRDGKIYFDLPIDMVRDDDLKAVYNLEVIG